MIASNFLRQRKAPNPIRVRKFELFLLHFFMDLVSRTLLAKGLIRCLEVSKMSRPLVTNMVPFLGGAPF